MVSCGERINHLRLQGHAWVLFLLPPLLAVGCRPRPIQSTPPQAHEVEAAPMNRDGDASSRFDHILEILWDKDEKVRETGMKDLADFQKDMKAPGSQVGLKALRAAA